MTFDCYILFNADTGEPVPPLDSTGEPCGMWYDTLLDAEESAKWHLQAYGITSMIHRCRIEVYE